MCAFTFPGLPNKVLAILVKNRSAPALLRVPIGMLPPADLLVYET
ncbi:MAG TPA: hypothetical protein VFW98_18130 [Gemmatimonadaceae bacterium]|nr:hypothetical protein [Gemmatimonadaceae bacterium]